MCMCCPFQVVIHKMSLPILEFWNNWNLNNLSVWILQLLTFVCNQHNCNIEEQRKMYRSINLSYSLISLSDCLPYLYLSIYLFAYLSLFFLPITFTVLVYHHLNILKNALDLATTHFNLSIQFYTRREYEMVSDTLSQVTVVSKRANIETVRIR